MGVAVEDSLVTSAAFHIGCSTLTAPFSYLGVNVGGNMSRIASWDGVINKVLNRLSKWKMKVLSVGGATQRRFWQLQMVSLQSRLGRVLILPNTSDSLVGYFGRLPIFFRIALDDRSIFDVMLDGGITLSEFFLLRSMVGSG
ncbi:hypothetical protein Tco_0323719 [Tanacetum coccineum]